VREQTNAPPAPVHDGGLLLLREAAVTRTPAAAEAALFLTAITAAGALGALIGAIIDRRLRGQVPQEAR
jgi:hypothetical protein